MNTTTHPLSTYWLVRNRREPGIAALASFLPDVPYLIALGWGAIRYGVVEGNVGRAVLEAWSNPIANFATQKLSHNLLLVTLFGLVATLSKRDAWKAFAFGWAMHVWVDLSLHVKDAYSVVWPVTRRVFPAPVSYWDSEHHASIAGPLLAVMAAVLWGWLARRRWRAGATRGPRAQAVACVVFAAISLVGIVTGPRLPERVKGSWAEDGLLCLPPAFHPVAAALARNDGHAALAELAGVEPARVVADEGCPGLPSWAAHDPTALHGLFSGYAHDLLGDRAPALDAYYRAERIETVGSVGDKARRYQGEPFRNLPDPPVGTAWAALFVWGLSLCVVLFTRLRPVENPPMRPLAVRIPSASASASASAFALAVVTLVFVSAPEARAACPVIQSTVDTLAPATGATGLPVNADVAFGTAPSFASYDPVVVLTASSGGGAVPGALLSGPAGSWIFSPDATLLPSRTYTVAITDAGGLGAPASTTFTTGTTSDTTDPVIGGTPVLTLDGYTDPVRTDECQQPGYWNVRVDWEDAVDASPVIYALEVQIIDLIPQDFAPASGAGAARPNVVTRLALTSVVSERVISVQGDSEVTVAIYAIDAAGRQGHSADGLLETPPAPISGGGGGCSCEIASTDGDYDAKTTGGVLGAITAILMLSVVSLILRRTLRE